MFSLLCTFLMVPRNYHLSTLQSGFQGIYREGPGFQGITVCLLCSRDSRKSTGRGQTNDAQAFNAWQMACANKVGLLSACVERALSSLPNGGGNGGSGTIARRALTHLAGTGRVNLANYSTCLHRLARVAALPAHSGGRDNNNCNGGGTERSRGGPGRCWTQNLRCWCARSRDGLWGGPRLVCFGGE